jgi:hypothetical protein
LVQVFLVPLLLAACLSGCGSSWTESARGVTGTTPAALAIGPGRVLPAVYDQSDLHPPRGYRVHALHFSAQYAPQTGASMNALGVKLGRGHGWSLTFADNFFGAEGWMGGATYDVDGASGDAHLFFIRGGLRAAYLDLRPFYAYAGAGVSLDWLSSSEFEPVSTVDIGDEDDFAPVGFYFRFGGGLMLGSFQTFAEFVTTSAWMSDADFVTTGWLTTWAFAVGVGAAF